MSINSMVLWLAAIAAASLALDPCPTVKTTTGTIRGKHSKSSGKHVGAFLGIPYALPPVGQLRFQRPQPIGQWSGEYDATKKPPPCHQTNKRNLPWISHSDAQTEDCLYLNVWVPNAHLIGKPHQSKKTIMIWIYGGGFYSGSTDLDLYDGEFLAGHNDVIVASMNYRLGSFGFLTTKSSEALGNMGMFDQVLALKWIKENAEAFGGDPSKIVIFGESVGGTATFLHTISPLSNDLFKRVIMQSGIPNHPLMVNNQISSMMSTAIARAVGCVAPNSTIDDNPEDAVKCLKDKDPNVLVQAENAILQTIPIGFVPICGDDFLPVCPSEAVNSGPLKKFDFLIGSNRDEGSVFLQYALPELLNNENPANLTKEQAKAIIIKLFATQPNLPANVVADYYLNEVGDEDYQGIRKAIYDSFGDNSFVCPSVYFAEKNFASKNNVYYYYFVHRPSDSPFGKWLGVTHFAEVAFVFGVPLRNHSSYTEGERKLSICMMEKWTHFAKYGQPTHPTEEYWPEYNPDHPIFVLDIHRESIGKGPQEEHCNFWRPYFGLS